MKPEAPTHPTDIQLSTLDLLLCHWVILVSINLGVLILVVSLDLIWDIFCVFVVNLHFI